MVSSGNGLFRSLFGGGAGRSSIILLVMVNAFNALNLIFSVAMAYLLSLESYGVLIIIMSSITILAIFSESIQTVVSKYVSNESSSAKVNDILRRSARKAVLPSSSVYIIFILLSVFASYTLGIALGLFVLAGLMVFLGFYNSITRGVLQGRKRFYSLGVNMVAEGGVKLILSVLLVFIGLGVYGAVIGTLMGGAAALFLSQVSLRRVLLTPSKNCVVPRIYQYARPVFITMLSVVLFLSIDVVLAGIFFDPTTTGSYALASTIAKIVFIGTQPVSKAMFPYTSDSKRANSSLRTFAKSLGLLSVILLLALVLVFSFSKGIVFLFSGKVIPVASQILPYLTISMSLLSVTNLVLFYGLSVGRTKHFWLLLFFILLQVVLLFFFNNSVLEFSLASILASVCFLGGSILAVLSRK